MMKRVQRNSRMMKRNLRMNDANEEVACHVSLDAPFWFLLNLTWWIGSWYICFYDDSNIGTIIVVLIGSVMLLRCFP